MPGQANAQMAINPDTCGCTHLTESMSQQRQALFSVQSAAAESNKQDPTELKPLAEVSLNSSSLGEAAVLKEEAARIKAEEAAAAAIKQAEEEAAAAAEAERKRALEEARAEEARIKAEVDTATDQDQHAKPNTRDTLLREIFCALDVHRTGRVGSAQVRRFATLTGFDGTEARWCEEYKLLCKESHRHPDEGFDEAAFCALVNDSSEKGCYCGDEELHDIRSILSESGVAPSPPQIVCTSSSEPVVTIATPQRRAAVISLPQKRHQPLDGDDDSSAKVFLVSASSGQGEFSRPALAGQDQRRLFSSGVKLKKVSASVTFSLSDDEG
jgi:hypothetical protein